MKNKWLLAALLAGNSWFGGGATDVDPVIMRVNNKDIHKSEFEYIYNKNSQQQNEQKTSIRPATFVSAKSHAFSCSPVMC